jgi:hypothetical protein
VARASGRLLPRSLTAGCAPLLCALPVAAAATPTPTPTPTATLTNKRQGSIPDCFTKSNTLKHLYLSDNALSGPLPDFSADSALQLLFVRNQQANGQPTLSGALPASLAAAAGLQYLQVAANALSGGIPELPASLKCVCCWVTGRLGS